MAKDDGPSGHEMFEILQTFEDLLGGELSGAELAELVNAVDPPSEEKRKEQQ